MNANRALVFDFAQEQANRAHHTRPRNNLADIQQRIERCSAWLASKKLCVLGFVGSTLSDPVVIVAPHPAAWILFSGRANNKGHKQEGALRYEIWEGFDRLNQVNVRWQEVVACA